LLTAKGFPTDGLSSQSWDDYATPDVPQLDAVITVCGSTAGETCPLWDGAPLRAHWGVEDPAAAAEPDWDQAFTTTFDRLDARAMELFATNFVEIDQATLQRTLNDIGLRH
jgi:protein-tyrosine-phosphatase